jgi:hypothetical protein
MWRNEFWVLFAVGARSLLALTARRVGIDEALGAAPARPTTVYV